MVATGDGKDREIAWARDFDRLTVSANGRVALQETLDGDRMVIGMYDPAAQRYSRVTSGPKDIEPLFHPTEDRLAYIEWSRRRIQLCKIDEPGQCRTILEGEEPYWLAGFSPDGERLAYFSKATSGSRLRVATITDRKVVDLGHSFLRKCLVRWTTSQRLWAFRAADNPHWVEMDLRQAGPTGTTEPVPKVGADGCPETRGSGIVQPLRRIRRDEAAVWRYRVSD